MPAITDAKILILSTHGFERSELVVPRDSLAERGATVHVASPEGGEIRSWDGGDWGDSHPSDLKLADVKVEDYDALVLPGGQINPDLVRVNEQAIALIRAFTDQGRIVAAICHAPWLLIEAGVVRGRDMTSYPSIRTDLRNAGASVVDRPVVTSNGVVTSRNPGDLPAFVDKIVEEIEEGHHERAA